MHVHALLAVCVQAVLGDSQPGAMAEPGAREEGEVGSDEDDPDFSSELGGWVGGWVGHQQGSCKLGGRVRCRTYEKGRRWGRRGGRVVVAGADVRLLDAVRAHEPPVLVLKT